jgi:hypothetical protein
MMSTNESGSDRLAEALTTELADLDARMDRIDRKIEDTATRLDSLQIERKRYEELREHVRALLRRGDNPYPESPADIALHSNASEMLSPPSRVRYDSDAVGETGLDLREDLAYRQRSSPNRRKGDSISTAVFEILKSRESLDLDDRPLHYRDLLLEIENRGIYVSGRDPGLNLIAHIHKDERFTRPRRGCYGLTEWYPEGIRRLGERSGTRRGRRSSG